MLHGLKSTLLSFLLAFLCLGSLPLVFGAKGPQGDSPDLFGLYARIESEGLDYLVNPSFEAVLSDGSALESWAMVKASKPLLTLIVDAEKTFDGQNCVRIRSPKLTQLYGPMRDAPTGKLRVSTQAHGHGQMQMALLLYGAKGNNGRPKLLSRLHIPKLLKIDHAKWASQVWEVEVPQEIQIQGSSEPVLKIVLQIGVKGDIWLDACSVTKVQEVQKWLETNSTKAALPDDRPLITIPRLASAPQIDGIMTQGEWRGAAAVTGFVSLDTQALSPQQTVVYAGYDAERLYFSYVCRTKGRFVPGKAGRDIKFQLELDAIELWLVSPQGKWFHFVGWPAGGFIDANASEKKKWNGDWRFRNHVKIMEDSVGGVQTFQDHLWVAELSIARKDIGATGSLAGQDWKINFCRDFTAAPGANRTGTQWSTWSPLRGSFGKVEQFATVRFGEGKPVVQVLKVGALSQGNLSIRGSVAAGKSSLEIETIARRDDGRSVSYLAQTIPAKAQNSITLGKTLNSLNPIGLHYQWLVRDKATGQVLARQKIRFKTEALLGIELVPLFLQKQLDVSIDTSRLNQIPLDAKVQIQLQGPSGSKPVTRLVAWSPNTAGRQTIQMPMGGLLPGTCQVNVTVQVASRAEPMAVGSRSFVYPTLPDWLDNTVGVDDAVLEPWHAIRVTKTDVSITDRRYALGETGLPRQMTVLNKELFATAPQIKLVIAGHEQVWHGKALQLLEQKDAKVTWSIDQRAGSLSMRGTVSVSFDGFVLWDVTFSNMTPKQKLEIDELSLVFPMRKKRALYARGENAKEYVGQYFAALFKKGTPQSQKIAMGNYSPSGWAWPDQWLHEMWVGDDDSGLSIMTESDQYLRGQKKYTITPDKQTQTLKVYLLDGATLGNKPLHYRYAWQATPVKPRPTNPKLTHIGWTRPREKAFLTRGFQVNDYWALKGISYPALYNPIISKKRFAIYREHGIKVVPYFIAQAMSTDAPELKPFGPAWQIRPATQFGLLRGQAQYACPKSTFANWVCHSLQKIVDELDMDGLYLDVSAPAACANHHHGCGYFDPQSKTWKPTVNVFATRHMYMRMYRFLKSNGRDGVLIQHTLPTAAVTGFVDTLSQGEDWVGEGKRQYDRLTPEIFRVKEMRTQYGTPCTWYTFFHYYRGEQYGGRVPLSAILTYTLPHRMLPTDNRAGMWPVWDLMDQYWNNTTFIGYWSDETALEVDQPLVLASAYVKKQQGKALLVIANWNKQPRKVRVKLDVLKLTGQQIQVAVKRALKHPIRQPQDVKNSDKMPNSEIRIKGQTINLDLEGRNLELIEVSWPAPSK